MLSKRLGVLGVLAATSALAQVSSGPVSPRATEVISKFRSAPMRFHAKRLDGSVESGNWSGYAVTGSAFTDAKGSWVVPKTNCTKTPNTYAAFWVGIDGYSSPTVEQTGTLVFCNGTSPEYYAWYEFYPKATFLITSVPVSPGDKISAEVAYNGSKFVTTITNETTGKSFSKKASVSGAKRSSAEWIAEAPCCTTGGDFLPLSDFGKALSGEDSTGVNDTNYATDKSITGPISDFGGTVEEIIMVNTKGKDKALPSALTTDGSSFKVAGKSE